MGRFYKTAKPTFVDDTMYQAPWELMAEVMGTVDKQIGANEEATLSLYDDLKAEGLQVDQPRLKEIISGYTGQVDKMAEELAKNPLEYRKRMPQIKNLSRQIQSDWQSGEVAAIQSNKAAYDTWMKDQTKRLKGEKGYVTADDLNHAKNYFLQEFTKKEGTSYKAPGDYQQIELEELNPFVDIESLGEERAKGYAADVVKELGAFTDGKYIYKTVDKKEVVDPTVIRDGVLSAMINDKELTNYYAQQVRMGRLSELDVVAKMEAAAVRVANKYGYSEEEKGRTGLTGDPYGLENLRQSNRKKLARFKKNIKDGGISAGPMANAAIATREAQLEWDNKTLTKAGAIAKKYGMIMPTVTETNPDGTVIERAAAPDEAIRIVKQQLKTQRAAAERVENSAEILEVIDNIDKQIDNVQVEYNNGQAKTGWLGYQKMLAAQGHTAEDAEEIALEAKRSVSAYVKDGTINEMKGKLLFDGKEMYGSLSSLSKQLGAKFKIVPNSITPTIITDDKSKQNLNQIDVKLIYEERVGNKFSKDKISKTVHMSIPASELKIDLFK